MGLIHKPHPGKTGNPVPAPPDQALGFPQAVGNVLTDVSMAVNTYVETHDHARHFTMYSLMLVALGLVYVVLMAVRPCFCKKKKIH
jgi:hypothetical protein